MVFFSVRCNYHRNNLVVTTWSSEKRQTGHGCPRVGQCNGGFSGKTCLEVEFILRCKQDLKTTMAAG